MIKHAPKERLNDTETGTVTIQWTFYSRDFSFLITSINMATV